MKAYIIVTNDNDDVMNLYGMESVSVDFSCRTESMDYVKTDVSRIEVKGDMISSSSLKSKQAKIEEAIKGHSRQKG